MDNQDALSFYRKVAAIQSEVSKVFHNNKEQIHAYDLSFLAAYIRGSWLDLGSGDGYIINALAENAEQITCVEIFVEFSQHIQARKHLQVYNCDLLEFRSSQKFDVITLFDSLEHFNDQQIQIIYQNIFGMLADDGELIIKQQYGCSEKVERNTFSEELQHNYYINFQQLDAAQAMLEASGFTLRKVQDVYPARLNRWPDTHYYALVAQKLLR